MKSKNSNCKTTGKTFQFGARILQLQPPLTLEKLGLRACNSCRVAIPEKPPRFACSHSLLSAAVETQPGSAKKTQTKTLGGCYPHMLARAHQMEREDRPLPDESFLERNGVMK